MKSTNDWMISFAPPPDNGVSVQDKFNYGASLISTQNRVEVPFIIAKIGDYTFGTCGRSMDGNLLKHTYNITFPNFIKSISITKVNGAVNIYKLVLQYVIQAGDDPNLLDKIFGSVSNSRKIVFSYGDLNAPNYIYREEEAIITKVSTQIDFSSASIVYTVDCTSNAINLSAGVKNFPAVYDKPSDVIKKLLKNNSYGITTLFSGMKNYDAVEQNYLIASDDRQVSIPAKPNCSVLDYISYLVDNMVCSTDSVSSVKKENMYYWYVCDDVNNSMGGPYFKVVRINAHLNNKVNTYNTYELDIGYPSASYVTNFSLKSDDSWAILYNYSQKVKLPEYKYTIDNSGNVQLDFDPVISTNKYFISTEADKNWWSVMTQFPVQATVTIKGLLRPATLMSYLKINVYFYGKKSTASGVYIITKQEDLIDASGYKTTLSVLRIGEDTDSVIS